MAHMVKYPFQPGVLIDFYGVPILGSAGGFVPTNWVYAGASTDVIETERLTADVNPRLNMRGDDRRFYGPGTAPPNWGTHNAGSVGAGSDYLWGMEFWDKVAWARMFTFPRQHLTDGTNWLIITSPPVGGFPLSGSPNLTVSSTAGLASSGTLTVYAIGLGSPAGTGTITYTSIVDGTHLGGCSSSGLTTDTDTSVRYSDWITDSYGAPIYALGSTGGMRLNDQYKFNYAGIGSNSNLFDIIIGFLDDALRNTGSGIFFGADSNVIVKRIQVSGNNEFIVTADGHIFTFGINGLYANGPLTLGTNLNPWGVVNAEGVALVDNAAGSHMGASALGAGGTVVIATTAVGASSRILLTAQVLGTVTTPKALAVTARSPGVNFTITSADSTDTSTVAWVILDPI